jgi:hypothetical protein
MLKRTPENLILAKAARGNTMSHIITAPVKYTLLILYSIYLPDCKPFYSISFHPPPQNHLIKMAVDETRPANEKEKWISLPKDGGELMGSKIDVDLLLLDGAAKEWLDIAMPEGQVRGDIGQSHLPHPPLLRYHRTDRTQDAGQLGPDLEKLS